MKIAFMGSRGIPAKYGGFETFVEQISPRLVNNGYKVTVYCDNPIEKKPSIDYCGVTLVYQYTRKSKHSLLFYLEGLIRGLNNNDVVFVTGTAGSFFYVLNYFYKRILITNTDGIESRRERWHPLVKKLIKFSEKLAVKQSIHLIADSEAIKKYLLNSYSFLSESSVSTIEYGANLNLIEVQNSKTLSEFNLKNNDFYVVVARLVPENNILTIIEGFKKSNSKKKLIIVGNLNSSIYSKKLKQNSGKNIIFLGGIYDNKKLQIIRKGAFAYLHGHSVGGTNPSLLEAMASSNITICHDNIYNREVTANNQFYFNDKHDLCKKIEHLESLKEEELLEMRELAYNRIKNYYTWENMTNKYIKLLNTYETNS